MDTRFIEDLHFVLQSIEKRAYTKNPGESTGSLVKRFPELSFLHNLEQTPCSNQKYFDPSAVRKIQRHIQHFDHILVVTTGENIIGFALLEKSNSMEYSGQRPSLHLTSVCANFGFKVDAIILDYVDIFAMTLGINKIYRNVIQEDMDYQEMEVYKSKGYKQETSTNSLLVVFTKSLKNSPTIGGVRRTPIDIGTLFPFTPDTSGSFH